MTPPARPTASLAPTCSGCQCVLISVLMRVVRVAVLTAANSASAFAARPPSIISAPSGPGSATTLHPAPWSSVAPPRSVVEILAWANTLAGSNALPKATALISRKRRREERRTGLWRIVFVDGLVHARFAERPDVFPDALRRSEYRPRGALVQ